MLHSVQEQINEARRLYAKIGYVQMDLRNCLDEQQRADAAAREAAELLKNAEDEVKATADLIGDERLPKAKTSDAYKAAMRQIVADAHTDQLLGEVQQRDETRDAAETAHTQTEKARIELNAYKAQATLQTAILNAISGVGEA